MITTPQRNALNTTVFSPSKTPEQLPRSPRAADILGLRPRVKTLAKSLLDDHTKWMAVQSRGLTICQQIEAIKRQALDECRNEPKKSAFPDELRSPCAKFKVILTILDDVLATSRDVVRQLDAIQRMKSPATEGTLFRSWDLERLLLSAQRLSEAYAMELPIRRRVMQEIAHSRTKDELVLHESVWEFPCFVNERTVGLEIRAIRQECEVEVAGMATPVKDVRRNKH